MRVLTPSVSSVNPSSFCDKRRLVPCALWWSWYLQVVCPLTVDPLSDVQHAVVVEDLGAPETPVCLALRVGEWQKLKNGGFVTRSAKAFQAG